MSPVLMAQQTLCAQETLWIEESDLAHSSGESKEQPKHQLCPDETFSRIM